MGRPELFTPQICPFPFDDNQPDLIHPSLYQPHSIPNWHPDPLSRFATLYFLDRMTDRQTVRQTEQPTDRPTDGLKPDTHYPYIRAVNTGRIYGCPK